MKTVTELAAEYAFKYAKDTNSSEFLRAFNSYIAGYTGAEQNGVRSNYNDHKLTEAEETIKKLHGRLGELALRFDNVSVILEEVESLCKQWHSDDHIFENHGKVSPWAGWIPTKRGSND